MSNKKFMDLMCIRAGKGFELGGIYAGVWRKSAVWVYGTTDKQGFEQRIVQTVTACYDNGGDTITTSNDSSVVFVECYDYYKGRVTINLDSIYVDDGGV